MHRRVILIAGPTASGKSALALALAERSDAVVVNADSMQVYRDLRVLTARPTPEEERRVPHRLFGTVDAAANYSVGRWLDDLAATLAATPRERSVVIVGGTGLYFRTALLGLSDMPEVPPDLRERIRDAATGKTPQELHAELARQDPLTASRLRPTDPQRILRALEIFAATGRPLASYQERRAPPLLDAPLCDAYFLAPERETLFTRIDRRFDQMMETGAVEEAAALRARRLDPALPAMRAHGVPHLIAWMEGRMSREAAVARGKLDTRHYAKRQFTFARHQLPTFRWLSTEDPLSQIDALREKAQA